MLATGAPGDDERRLAHSLAWRLQFIRGTKEGRGTEIPASLIRPAEHAPIRRRRSQEADSFVKINAQLVNPFVEAAKTVVKQVTGHEARQGHLTYGDRPETRFGVSIVVGVHGCLEGQVVYNMKTEVAEKLVERMHPDTPPRTGSKPFSDAIGGFAEMVTGKAIGLLKRGDEEAAETTAPVVVSDRRSDADLVARPTLVIGLHTRCGQMEINVALEGTGGWAR
jgi:chemotaxis protein CheX